MESDGPRELTRRECLALLTTTRVGRLARNDDEGPTVVPVNYLVHDGAILLRSLPGGKVDAAEQGEAVSFEVDGVDVRRRSGWSVLLRGPLSVVAPSGLDVSAADPAGGVPVPDSFAAGPGDALLRLEPVTITGRRLRIVPAGPRSWEEVTELGHVWFGTDASDLLG